MGTTDRVAEADNSGFGRNVITRGYTLFFFRKALYLVILYTNYLNNRLGWEDAVFTGFVGPMVTRTHPF